MLFFESLGWNVDGHASQDTKFNTVVEFERFVLKHIDAGLSIMVDWVDCGYYTFPLGRFYEMWFEGPCANKVNPYKQPYIVAYPKINE